MKKKLPPPPAPLSRLILEHRRSRRHPEFADLAGVLGLFRDAPLSDTAWREHVSEALRQIFRFRAANCGMPHREFYAGLWIYKGGHHLAIMHGAGGRPARLAILHEAGGILRPPDPARRAGAKRGKRLHPELETGSPVAAVYDRRYRIRSGLNVIPRDQEV